MIYEANLGQERYLVEIARKGEAYTIKLGDKEYVADVRKIGKALYSLLINNHSYNVEIRSNRYSHSVDLPWGSFQVDVYSQREGRLGARGARLEVLGRVEVSSPMPGRVVKILKEVDEQVREAEGVIVVEAMKMENELRSPKEGKVVEVCVAEGDAVNAGEVLVVVE